MKMSLITLVAGAALATVSGGARTALALNSQQDSDQYLHDVWTTEDGLPQNSITSIVQTQDGYLWLGTFGGLVRFDGLRFKVFQVGNNRIISLCEDHAGRLWIGTGGSGVFQYSAGMFRAATAKDGLANAHVWSIYEDGQGTLWVGTEAGLIRRNGDQWTTYTTKDGLPNNAIRSIYEDRQGRLWIGTRGGLARFKDGRFIRFTEKAGLPPGRVFSFLQDRRGDLWLGVDRRLVQLHNGAVRVYTTRDGLPSGDVRSLLEDHDGSLWIGQWRGLCRLKHRTIIPFTLPGGGSIGQVRTLLEDREGNLWIGTSGGGLHRLRRRMLVTYDRNDGLPADDITAITEDGEGGLWIGTNGGGLVHFTGGRFTTSTGRDGFADKYLQSLSHDRAGRLWIGTLSGLHKLEAKTFSSYAIAGGPANTPVHAIYEDRAGRLWIGTGTRGLYQLKDGHFTAYRTADGLVDDDVRFITEDRQGGLWIGTMGGMSRFLEGRFTNYTTEDGLPNNVVRAIHQDADGTLWIGTYGGGLTRFKDGAFFHFTTENGLFDNVVSRILEDGRERFWMTGNRGLFWVSRQELNDVADGRRRAYTCVSYGLADGMNSGECNGGSQPAGWKTRDGKLWFPTIKGVVVIDPDRLNPLPPKVAIERVLVDRKPVDQRGRAEIPPCLGNLEIHYTGLSLVAPEKLQFKYKLEGYDREWIHAGARRVAYYTKIPPGRYRFRLTATNNDGVWNPTGTTFEFRLRPHFYQTSWFSLLCGTGLLLLGWGGYRLRVRRLERHTQALAAKVAERTAEVVEQKNQLSRANQDMLSILNQLQQGAILTDSEGRVAFLNQAAEGLFGQRRADALGQPWERLFPLRGEDQASLQALYHQSPGRCSKVSVRLQTTGGRRYWIEIEILANPRDPGQRIFFLYDVSEVYDLRRLLDERAKFHDLVGESLAMLLVFRQIEDLAQVDTTVLIEGETGVGKELAARAIHAASGRKHHPFIAVNCAGLSESLLSSQLFGHKRGAFTGAVADQVGLLEAAHGGTLFLDEIGDMPASVQTALLRVLQQREITRLGETTPQPIDVRVIVATHRDLNRAVAEGRFRQDLLYRIRVSRICIPSLRDRRRDIPLLTAWFLGQIRETQGKPVQDVSQEAMRLLMAYRWPGNVRELKSAIESAVIRCKGPIIHSGDLPAELGGPTPPQPPVGGLNPDERQRILDALERAGGNRKQAAQLLGIGRTTLYRRMKELGIQ